MFNLRFTIYDFRFKALLLFLLFIANAEAQKGFTKLNDKEKFTKNLEQASTETKTIESEFIQEKNLSVLTNKIISKGKFYYRRNSGETNACIRWEYIEPYKYLIIIANNKIFIKDKENKKEYDTQSNNIFKEMNNFIMDCIQGKIINRDKDYIAEYMENEKLYYVRLEPLKPNMKEIIKGIEIYFDKENLSVTKIKFSEEGGDYTTIEFINRKYNVEISNEKFDFR